jgi:hypothetical protein
MWADVHLRMFIRAEQGDWPFFEGFRFRVKGTLLDKKAASDIAFKVYDTTCCVFALESAAEGFY